MPSQGVFKLSRPVPGPYAAPKSSHDPLSLVNDSNTLGLAVLYEIRAKNGAQKV